MPYPAHLRRDASGRRVEQSVETHCRNCADYAALFAPDALKNLARLAGFIHDLGKNTDRSRAYQESIFEGNPMRRGSVNHTFAGARFMMERWHTDQPSIRNLTAEVIACAAAAHHGQFDCLSPQGADGFLHRLTDETIHYQQAKEHFLHYADLSALDRLYECAVQEVEAAVKRLQSLVSSADEMQFCLALLTRQVLSAVIEGDRRDTAEFMQGKSHPIPETTPQALWRSKLDAVEARIRQLPSDSSINAARTAISDRCRMAARAQAGVFRLHVPTGGGKTLTSLRYSLAVAAAGKNRIFFVIPLLSVLEQNAKVLRDYLGRDIEILEHHSNLVHERPAAGELDPNELLLENWQSPVVITTLVQLLNTLFAGSPTNIRRMNALNDSVIVIDEVQSVPRQMLSLFNLALNFLSGFCGATIVLCSATQPCLDKARHGVQYAGSPELVPYDPALWQVFRRTEIIDRRKPEGYTFEELSRFCVENAACHNSLLFVCNTKSEARALCHAVKDQWSGLLFHLSTGMCMAHRIRTLRQINRALEQHRPVICVSTQLIEAGVDISFGCVIRMLAGMESIVQSAGRCNRSGEFGALGPVYIVNLRGENLNRLKDIRQSQQAAESLLIRYERDPASFGHDLTSAAAVQVYYQTLYAEMKQDGQDYPLTALHTTIYDLLSMNQTSRSHCKTQGRYTLGQAFQTAGSAFRVFDDNQQDVLVPFSYGRELIAELCSDAAAYDLTYRKKLLLRAKRFTISLYQYELDKLREAGGIHAICDDSILVMDTAYYSDTFGFSPDGDQDILLEV